MAEGLFTLRTTKLSRVIRSFFHGYTSWSRFHGRVFKACIFKADRSAFFTNVMAKGVFTLWTTKLSHVIWHFPMVTVSRSDFPKKCIFKVGRSVFFTNVMAQGLFTLWTTKLSHVIGPFSMVTLHSHTPTFRFPENAFLKPVGWHSS